MSGIAETSLVLGLISSVITIFEAAQEIYDASNDAAGLPVKFRAVADQIPLVYHALDLARNNIEDQNIDGESLHSASLVLKRCETHATRIKDVLDKALPGPDATKSQRLRQAMVIKTKSKKLKEDMEEVFKSMELLARYQLFRDSAVLQEVNAALEELTSLPDDNERPQFSHSGTGAINANNGPGSLRNNNNIYKGTGSGHQYNAETLHVGRDQVDHQTNIIQYYTLHQENVSLSHSSRQLVGSPHSLSTSERDFLATIGPRRFINIPERVDGTCMWSTKTPQYTSWVESNQSSILWITGAAGTGKTTVANYLVEYIEENLIETTDSAFCSFFCSRDDQNQRDVCSLLQDLVLQLLQHDTKVLRQIKSKYGITKQDHSWSFGAVWKMFESTIGMLSMKQIYIVLDALDECNDNLVPSLLDKLAKLFRNMTTSSRAKSKMVKLVISSQPLVRNTWESSGSSIERHHIDMDNPYLTAQDFSLFLEDKMNRLVRQEFISETVCRQLKSRIISKSENSFLWLTIVSQHINSSLHHRITRLEDILDQVPLEMQQIYAKYLPRIRNDEVSLLQCYLQLLIGASRPLNIAEIDIFSSLQDEQLLAPSSVMTATGSKAVQNSMHKALGPLIRFSNGTAQFVHSKVKDFFASLAKNPAHPLHSTYGIQLPQAHLFCLRSCMTYLLHETMPMDIFGVAATSLLSTQSETSGPGSFTSEQQSQNEDLENDFQRFFELEEVCFMQDEDKVEEETCVEIRNRFAAYHYAATNWTYHFANCGVLVEDADVSKAVLLLSSESGQMNNWYRYASIQSQLRVPQLHESSSILLAAMFDLTRPLEVLYRMPNYHTSSLDLFSAVYWAASRGSVSTLRLLLEYGAPVSPLYAQRLPLAVAVRGGFIEVCRCLLSATDVNPNQIDYCGKPALALAAESDNLDVLRLLLSHPSIDVNCLDHDGRTALASACRSSSAGSIRALREDGRANVNTADEKGRSPLHHASVVGNSDTMEELLKFSAIDFSAIDKSGRNAMSLAAQEGHLHIVRELHSRKVSAAVKDKNGRNAVSWAANSLRATERFTDKDGSVLEYLTKAYPDEVDVPDADGWTPLAWALDPIGYVKSVRILIKSSLVDINRTDRGSGKCILAWAANSGMNEIVQHLLRRSDLIVDRACFSGQTALHYAAMNGLTDTVRLLLEMGNASPHLLDQNAKTAADYAEQNGHTGLADLLRLAAKRKA